MCGRVWYTDVPWEGDGPGWYVRLNGRNYGPFGTKKDAEEVEDEYWDSYGDLED